MFRNIAKYLSAFIWEQPTIANEINNFLMNPEDLGNQQSLLPAMDRLHTEVMRDLTNRNYGAAGFDAIIDTAMQILANYQLNIQGINAEAVIQRVTAMAEAQVVIDEASYMRLIMLDALHTHINEQNNPAPAPADAAANL